MTFSLSDLKIEPALTVAEVAFILNVGKQTVRKLIKEGKLKARRYTERGQYRIPAGEVVKLLEN